MSQRDRFVTLAQAYGFNHVGFAPLSLTPHFERYAKWIDAGHHGTMDYLAKNPDVREDPRLRLPNGASAVVLAMEYDHHRPPDPGGLTGKVAAYAWGRDYHNLIGKRLKKFKKQLFREGITVWGGVDTAPILERSWASQAGVGFNGKNSVQILPARGSFMFLSVLFVDVEIESDTLLRDHCGSCTRCLDICPTQAFNGPRSLDARKCIAYWTIEDPGPIPLALREGFGRWFFGCDDCQTICPHNVRPPHTQEADFLPKHAWIDLEYILTASEEDILSFFEGSPIRRPGAEGLRRNACVVLGNLKKPDAVPLLRRTADHGSALVSEHARWALEQLGG